MMGDRSATFISASGQQLTAWVKVRQRNRAGIVLGTHDESNSYTVSFSDYLRFPDGSRIDGTCRIKWDPNRKPAQLGDPWRSKLPLARAIAVFKEEL